MERFKELVSAGSGYSQGDSLREPRAALSAGNPLDTAWGMCPTGASTGLMATKPPSAKGQQPNV